MRLLRNLLIGALILVGAFIFIRTVFAVQIGSFLFKRAVSQGIAVDATADLPDGLHVILVGTGSPLPDPMRAGPMTAVLAGDRLFIVDAGGGAARRFGELRLPWTKVEGVLLTHFHSDHIDGLGEVMLQRWAAGGWTTPLPVIGPTGVTAVVDGLNTTYAQDAVYRVAHHGPDVVAPSGQGGTAIPFNRPVMPVTILEDEGLTIQAVSVDHSPVEPAVAYRFDYHGRCVTISGDTVKDPRLISLAKDCDLLVHEALHPDMVATIGAALEANGSPRLAQIMADIPDYHASPVDAAESAEEAGVDLLVLSHIVPAQPSRLLYPAYLKGTKSAFSGKTIMGEDGMAFTLPADSKKIIRKRLD